MVFRLIAAAAALLLAGAAYFIIDLFKKRRELDGLPQPPMLNRLVGHLHIAQECQEVFPANIHAHAWADYIRAKYDLPEIFYVDWRPFGPKWMFVADPELAAQYVTTAQSLPKSSLESGYLYKFLGRNNLITLEGAHWKELRSMFNPGFSAVNIMTLTDYIVDAGLVFTSVLREKARTAELFQLEEYATRLTVDIIGRVTLDIDMQSQKSTHPIMKAFRERVPIMPRVDTVFPWEDVDLFRPLKLWLNGRKLDRALSKELDLKISQRGIDMQRESKGSKSSVSGSKRSVVDLALNAWEKQRNSIGGSDEPGSILTLQDLPAHLRTDIIDSVKTFFFAGHDTSASTICYVFYLLHRYPETYVKIKAELNSLFPQDVDGTATKLKEDPYIINKLDYTTAVIKETLRIFPPASTVRWCGPASSVTDPEIVDPQTGRRYPMANTHIYPVAHMIHRNTRFFPEPTQFIPDRFIPSLTPFPYPKSELFTPAGKDAYRPFEKGPRNCIGQELAMVEMKIILALTVRVFDFVVEFPGEKPDVRYDIPSSSAEEFSTDTEYGRELKAGKIKFKDRVEGHRVFQVLEGSAKPAGGCSGRIKLRDDAEM